MAEPVKVTIARKRWTISWHRGISYNGESCYGLTIPDKREIRIRKRLSGINELDTLIHELSHAGHGYLDELAVDGVSTDIAKALWKLGYRRTTPEQRKSLGID